MDQKADHGVELARLTAQMEGVRDAVATLPGLHGLMTRALAKFDEMASDLKEMREENKQLGEELHTLATSQSNHEIVLFGPKGSQKMGVVYDVSRLVAAYNQGIGGWKVAALAVAVGQILAPIISWALAHFAPHP